MSIKKIFLKYNIFSRIRIKRLQQRLRNKDITILSSNCLGGLIYHELGLEFLSPTVNLRFSSPDFVKFICDMEHYLEFEFAQINSEELYPVALLDDIVVHLVHYHSMREAIDAWNRRKKRINRDNIFVILNDCDGMSKNELEKLKNCKIKNICVFTAQKYPEYPFCFHILQFKDKESVGNTMKKNILTGEMVIEKEFDFVGWFNQDSGSCLESYRRKKYMG